jgi:hypothetical protein
VPDLIAEALAHITTRYKAENAILANITEVRDDAVEPARKRRAAQLVDIVRDCIRRHKQLQARLQEAGATFRAEQDGSSSPARLSGRPLICSASCSCRCYSSRSPRRWGHRCLLPGRRRTGCPDRCLPDEPGGPSAESATRAGTVGQAVARA